MDRKAIIIIVLCVAMVLLWTSVIVPKLFPPIPIPPEETNAQPAPAIEQTNAVAAPSAPAASTGAPRLAINTNVEEKTLWVTNENARYTFTSHGGGLKYVELLHYPENVSLRRKSVTNQTFVKLNAYGPAPIMAVLDGEAIQGDGIFDLIPRAHGVRAEKKLPSGLTLVKEFEVTTNYLVSAIVRVENHSGQRIALPTQEWVVGTASPMDALDDGMAVGMMWHNGKDAQDVSAPWFANRTLGCIPGTPRTEFRGGQSNVVWAAAHNQFFAITVMPKDPATEIVARRLELPRPTGELAQMAATNKGPPIGYETVLVYPALSLETNQVVQREFFIFAGPKEYRTLARIANRFQNNLDAIMNFGSIWGWVAKGLLLGMNWLHEILRLGYGWTIVVITLIIKITFWPLTAASTRSMKRMQALQPQIKAIQEKYKDDPMKGQKKTMELWKENKVNPMGGCLPMLIQMPVFIGFFTMIRSAIELRGASFLWIPDLARPDTLFVIPGLSFIPFIGVPGVGLPFNLLPLIMGVTMLWQSHLAPPSPGMDPMQQKIMRYMPLIFVLFLYNYSAGLTLYWTVNNVLTIIQTKLTKTNEPLPAAPAKAPALTSPPKKRK